MTTAVDRLEYSRPTFRRMPESQLARIHEASLRILERTGVRLYEEEALNLMRQAGVEVSEGNRVRIPPKLVEWALSAAPRRFTIHDRDGRPAMPLGEGRSFFGPGSDCPWVLDHRTGERRRGTLDYLEQGIRVCDALPNIDFVMSLTLPADVADEAVVDRYQMRAMLLNSTKPIIFVSLELEGTKDAIRMAEVVAGGEEALRQKPNCVCYINYAHPLRHNEEALQRLLYAAEKGLPSIYCGLVLAGATGPVTAAGGIALANAGDLVGVVLAQLKREGAPVIVSGGYHWLFDMRAQGGSPGEPPRVRGIRPEMAHFYGLPVFGLGGATNAQTLDVQAGSDAALTLLVEAQSGADIVHDVGYMSRASLYSLQLLVICDDLIELVRRFTRSERVNEETLALDVIDDVGPDGQYLDHDHTLRHCREEWHPVLLHSGEYDAWAASGGQTLQERARERVEEILAHHEVPVLSADVRDRIDEIVARAAG